MRQPHAYATSALRYGLPSAISIAALGSANAAIQARRHTIGPSARGLVVFSYLVLFIAVLLLLAIGFLAARSTGRARCGAWAGVIAAGLPFALLALMVSVTSPTHQRLDTTTLIIGDIIVILLFAAAGGLAGALVSLPGALVGRAHYRDEHAAELAALAAERATHDAARPAVRPRRWWRTKATHADHRRTASYRDPSVWLLAAAIGLIAVTPAFAAGVAYEAVSRWQGLVLAAAGLVVGIFLLRAATHSHRLPGDILDWLGMVCLCSALVLGVAEVTGADVSPIGGAGALVYSWHWLNRSMRTHLPSPVEPPERPPVMFCYDGQAIVVYPSRRKLALHAAFAGTVALIAATLAVLLRGAGPTPVLALGVFAAMGLIMGFIPDLVRLLHRWPALIVTSEGVTDLASAHVLGFGLIPWHEIVGVVNMGTLRGGRFPELAIIPVSYHRLLVRQPLLKRPFLRLSSLLGGRAIYLSSIVLSLPPSVLARHIDDFVKGHAPDSYLKEG